MTLGERVAASYRDPSGFIFRRDGKLLRQINHVYATDYIALDESGLYAELIEHGLLTSHREVDVPAAEPSSAWKIIQPREVGFISYPYEWSFTHLKDAALCTLDVQKRAMARGLSLKDASAFNIQFDGGKPVLIDTLSFERYVEGQPWAAYRQFCQHFLAPLALMSLVDVRFNRLFLNYLDGIPLDLASKLLPVRSRLRLGLLVHLHVHAGMDRKHAGSTAKPVSSKRIPKTQLLGIIDSLESAISGLNWRPIGTEWADYYQDTNYSASGMLQKLGIVSDLIAIANPSNVWDLGANTGEFSRLASEKKIPTLAFDIDPAAVEVNYLRTKSKGETDLLPLLMDLTNPSPAAGWAHAERMSLAQRGPADLLLALALVHHLAISGNLPLGHIAEFFSRLGKRLIIEFVPKNDSQVQRLLVVRKDVFDAYTIEAFEAEFGRYFAIDQKLGVEDSSRVIYLMTRRENP